MFFVNDLSCQWGSPRSTRELSRLYDGCRPSPTGPPEGDLGREKADDVVFVSCPADADASDGLIGTKIDFRYAKLDNMTLEGANLEEAKFDYASCNGCSFAGATLDEADMDYMKASSANFTAATLDGADMVSACGRAL